MKIKNVLLVITLVVISTLVSWSKVLEPNPNFTEGFNSSEFDVTLFNDLLISDPGCNTDCVVEMNKIVFAKYWNMSDTVWNQHLNKATKWSKKNPGNDAHKRGEFKGHKKKDFNKNLKSEKCPYHGDKCKGKCSEMKIKNIKKEHRPDIDKKRGSFGNHQPKK